VAFYLNNYTRTDELLAAINDIQYGGHPPNLSAGLNAVRTDIFNASNGARHDPSVMRLAVVFVTENPSSNRLPTMIEAREAADMDIGIVTVGVGTFVDRQLLSSITSYPSSKNMFIVPSVRDVTDLADPIKRIICSGILCLTTIYFVVLVSCIYKVH